MRPAPRLAAGAEFARAAAAGFCAARPLAGSGGMTAPLLRATHRRSGQALPAGAICGRPARRSRSASLTSGPGGYRLTLRTPYQRLRRDAARRTRRVGACGSSPPATR